ncbi:MAG: hypothetical protein IRY85_23150 [Micromonosporaceae bacterium]|nr:hypothetical protein [Micromonosporaceae bacterium]
MTQTQPYQGSEWQSPSIGNIPYEGKPIPGGTFTVTATAFDKDGQSATLTSGPVTVTPCTDTTQPVVTSVTANPTTIYRSTRCGSLESTITVRASDNSGLQLNAGAEYTLPDVGRFGIELTRTGFNVWTGVVGPIDYPYNVRTPIPVSVTVVDAAGNPAFGSTTIFLDLCIIIG